MLRLLVFLLSFGSITPFLGRELYWLELMTHFQWHYALVTVLLFFFVLYFRDKFLALFATLLLLRFAFLFLPFYTFPQSQASPRPFKVKILMMNVWAFNKDYEKVGKEIHRYQPDILFLMEVDEKWITKLKKNTESYPYQKLIPGLKYEGLAFYSRLPVDFEVIPFEKQVEDTVLVRPSIWAHFTKGTQRTDFLAIHPTAPVKYSRFEARNEFLKNLIHFKKRFSKQKVVLGDLNMTSYSPWFHYFCRELEVIDSRIGFGLQPSWREFCGLLQLPLDHFLVSSSIRVVKRETGKEIGSDHLPVYIELILD